MNIICIGHVNSGKSTLSGQLLINFQNIDKRQLEKLKEEAVEKKMNLDILQILWIQMKKKKKKVLLWK